MFKKFFDSVKLNAQVKIQKEALNTLSADIDMLVELMEHPVKKQNTIKALLADMKKVTKDALK